jgi:hypothetical protein
MQVTNSRQQFAVVTNSRQQLSLLCNNICMLHCKCSIEILLHNSDSSYSWIVCLCITVTAVYSCTVVTAVTVALDGVLQHCAHTLTVRIH